MAAEGDVAAGSAGVPLSHSALSTVSTQSLPSASGFGLAPRGWFSLAQPFFVGQFAFGTTFAIVLNVPLTLVPSQAMEIELCVTYKGAARPRDFVAVWSELGHDKYLQHFPQVPGPQSGWFPLEKGRLVHLYARAQQQQAPGQQPRLQSAVYFHVTRFR